MLRRSITTILLLLIVNYSQAQTCTSLGQTPATAFPVCGTASFVQNTVPLCSGNAMIVPGCSGGIDTPARLVKKYITKKIVREEVRPGVFWKRPPHLEDVYLKLTGSRLGVEGL